MNRRNPSGTHSPEDYEKLLAQLEKDGKLAAPLVNDGSEIIIEIKQSFSDFSVVFEEDGSVSETNFMAALSNCDSV